MPVGLWEFEKSLTALGFGLIAGTDEAGRGPLAGPVVSAAVILPSGFDDQGVDDSKKLVPARREQLYARIHSEAHAVGIGVVEAADIDRINILQAARRSMALAVGQLSPQPDFVLVDGNCDIPLPLPQQAVVKGDSRSISIAAASIIAKVLRDRMMQDYHRAFPQFGFDRHKGYPTKAHKAAIAAHGPCPIHRRSFKGVSEHLDDLPSAAKEDTHDQA